MAQQKVTNIKEIDKQKQLDEALGQIEKTCKNEKLF